MLCPLLCEYFVLAKLRRLRLFRKGMFMLGSKCSKSYPMHHTNPHHSCLSQRLFCMHLFELSYWCQLGLCCCNMECCCKPGAPCLMPFGVCGCKPEFDGCSVLNLQCQALCAVISAAIPCNQEVPLAVTVLGLTVYPKCGFCIQQKEIMNRDQIIFDRSMYVQCIFGMRCQNGHETRNMCNQQKKRRIYKTHKSIQKIFVQEAYVAQNSYLSK